MSETEGKHAGCYVFSDANGTRSVENVTIDTGVIVAGEILGKITKGVAAGAAVAGNTGDGTITAAPAVAAGAKVGVYRVTCIEPGTNVGDFLVEDPDGITLGVAVVAVEFVGGGLTFTIADGATDFISGDGFTVTIAAGSGSFVAYNQDGTDGTEVAVAILFDNVDATDADVVAVATVRDCEVNANDLTWPADILDAEKVTAIAQLAVLGIIVRDGSESIVA